MEWSERASRIIPRHNSWQPIETAPRDGTEILVYAPQGKYDNEWNDYEGRYLPVIATTHWDIEHPGHADARLQDNYAMWAGYYSAFGPLGGPATHWMPLPQPPENADD